MPRLKEGEILKSTGDEYTIIKYLGEGLTARVYKGERKTAVYNGSNYPVGSTVALKVLQEGLPADIQRNFRDEADLIARLSIEEQAVKLQKSLIPGLVERVTGSAVGQEFLAMEFIEGTPLDRRVREEGPLDEQVALDITDQVLTILDLLHTRLQKSYTDFQLQNIWLLPDGRSIKVMDWNHVSKEVDRQRLPELIDADLRRMGAYVYQIMTGKGAFQDGETGHALAARAGKRWMELSAGTRSLIRRALSPDPKRRFTTAAEFLAAVRQQQELWRANVDDVVDEAQNLMRPVSKALAERAPLGAAELEAAETWVDMADRRHPGDALVKNWKETIRLVTQEVSGTWGSGRQLLEGGQYRQAAAIWRAEAEAWGRADLWRRVMIADTAADLGNDGYKPIKESLENAVEVMNKEEWPAARDLFAAPPLAGISSSATVSLRREIDAQLDYLAARQAFETGQWADAAQGFRAVAVALPGIAYADVLRTQYDWASVGSKADEADLQAADEQQTDRRTSELARALADDLDIGLARVTKDLLAQPDSPAVIRLCEQEAARRPPADAYRLLLVALGYGVMPADQETRMRAALAKARLAVEAERETAESERRRQEAEAREQREREEREAAEARRLADQEAEDLKRRTEIEGAVKSERWADLAVLLVAAPKELSDEGIAHIRSAFDTAVDGANTRLAGEIAAVLDVVEPDTADDRRARYVNQQVRQSAAADAWAASLPAQVETVMRAGQYDDARNMIAYARPLLPAGSPVLDALRSYEDQLQEFAAVQNALAATREGYKKNSLGLDDVDRFVDKIKPRIAALSNRLSPESTEDLKRAAEALQYDVLLDRTRQELEAANADISAKRFDPAEERLAAAETHLSRIPDSHPGKQQQADLVASAKERLDKERKKGRTWMDRNGKWLLGLLAVLLVLLAAGLVALGLLNAREREARAQAEAALGTTEANFNVVQGTLTALQRPAAANIGPTQTIQAFQTQAAADAAALSAAAAESTQIAQTAEALGGTVTAAQVTPEPLAVTAVLAGAAPVPGTVGEGVPVFYDSPASMNVTAPPGWSFNLEPDRSLQIVDSGGVAWELNLKISTLISDTVVSATTTGIPAPLVRENPDDPNSRTVDLASLAVSLPREPGHYRLDWEALGGGKRTTGASPLEFEIVPPPIIKTDNAYRTQPVWDAQFRVDGTGGIEMEVLGKLDLDDLKDEEGNPPPTPDFLMVRRPGQTETFWLPSWNAELYGTNGTGAEWLALLNSLPNVSPPEAPAPEVEE